MKGSGVGADGKRLMVIWNGHCKVVRVGWCED